MNKRPLSITVVAGLYLLVGVIGFAAHLSEPLARRAFQSDDAWIEITELVAVACGVFLLRGRNWARWLALAWMAFHVVISFFDSLQKVAIHSLFFVLIAYFLFRPQSTAYFQRTQELRT